MEDKREEFDVVIAAYQLVGTLPWRRGRLRHHAQDGSALARKPKGQSGAAGTWPGPENYEPCVTWLKRSERAGAGPAANGCCPGQRAAGVHRLSPQLPGAWSRRRKGLPTCMDRPARGDLAPGCTWSSTSIPRRRSRGQGSYPHNHPHRPTSASSATTSTPTPSRHEGEWRRRFGRIPELGPLAALGPRRSCHRGDPRLVLVGEARRAGPVVPVD